MILGLRLSRRLVAVAGLNDERFVFLDSRFVPRGADASGGASRYFRQVLEQTKPTAVFFYAPTGPRTLTHQLILLLEQEASRLALVAKALSKTDVFASFGLLPLRTRRDLRVCVEALCPDLIQHRTQRQSVLSEAAAAALVGDFQQGLLGV